MTRVLVTTQAELSARGRVLYRKGNRQIVLFAVGENVFAVDNRCPHEGYPLKEGTVDAQECVLTCQWHNWKFDLRNGKNILGEDHVRSYAVHRQNGEIWLDVNQPPKGEIEARAMASFRTAFGKRQYGRIAREISRFLVHDLDPLGAVREAIRLSYDRLERGTTHAFAAAADWLTLYKANQTDSEKAVICLTEMLDHIASDILGEDHIPYSTGAVPFVGERFIEAIAAQDEAAALALVRGGLDMGLAWEDFEYWFARAALVHYAGFGHALIYAFKTGTLLAHLGPGMARYLLPPLVRTICRASREDLLPEFRELRKNLDKTPSQSSAKEGLVDGKTLFQRTTGELLTWVSQHFQTTAATALYDALLEACARNLLHVDTAFENAYDRPVSQNVGWLDFTHGLTFANAVRGFCTKYPDLWWPGLLQMASFAGRNKAYVVLEFDSRPWYVADPDAFWRETQDRLFDHGLGEPIFSCHLLKTWLAVREEISSASPPCAALLMAGLNRFLHSPIKQKHVRRAARQALALVSKERD